MNKYLTEKEVASYLGISSQKLRQSRMVTRKDGLKYPPFVKIGGSVRYSFDELVRWLDDNTRRI